jgi:hypothetical protein
MTVIELTSDDTLLVENYGRHWQAMGIEAIDVRGDWRSEAQDFLKQAREQSGLAAFVAKVEGQPVGTACCHLVQRAFQLSEKLTRISSATCGASLCALNNVGEALAGCSSLPACRI